ncbi:hypothetical protein ACA910_021425 [Epithemia clementina (nom. ined.)]
MSSSVSVSSTKSASRKYEPTPAEMTKAIETLKKKKNITDVSDVVAALKNAKKSWKISERRVAKFIKASNQNNPIRTDNEEENFVPAPRRGLFSSLFSSSSSNKERSKRRSGLFRGISKRNQLSPPENKNSLMLDQDKTNEDAPTVATIDTYPPEQAPEQAIYKDDNGGKRECGCLCGSL